MAEEKKLSSSDKAAIGAAVAAIVAGAYLAKGKGKVATGFRRGMRRQYRRARVYVARRRRGYGRRSFRRAF